jgi:hypothetical protein
MIAAGVSYDTRGLSGGVAPHAPAYLQSELPNAGMQWDMYGYGGACMQESGLDISAAMQQGRGGGLYSSAALMPAQQHRPGNRPSSALAKRRCGRPKAPNPLEDPNISEKRARRYALYSTPAVKTTSLQVSVCLVMPSSCHSSNLCCCLQVIENCFCQVRGDAHVCRCNKKLCLLCACLLFACAGSWPTGHQLTGASSVKKCRRLRQKKGLPLETRS